MLIRDQGSIMVGLAVVMMLSTGLVGRSTAEAMKRTEGVRIARASDYLSGERIGHTLEVSETTTYDDEGALEGVVLVEGPEGRKIIYGYRADSARDLSSHWIEDVASGWRAELAMSRGMRNLGRYWENVRLAIDLAMRSEQAGAKSGSAFATSNGFFARDASLEELGEALARDGVLAGVEDDLVDALVFACATSLTIRRSDITMVLFGGLEITGRIPGGINRCYSEQGAWREAPFMGLREADEVEMAQEEFMKPFEAAVKRDLMLERSDTRP